MYRDGNFAEDIHEMHQKFGVHQYLAWRLEDGDTDVLRALLDFRMSMLTEEYNETIEAHRVKDASEVIDGLIDIVVIALGTLDIMDVDIRRAWYEVMDANMMKEPGVKPERANPLGLPDMIKPSHWVGPDHTAAGQCDFYEKLYVQETESE